MRNIVSLFLAFQIVQQFLVFEAESSFSNACAFVNSDDVDPIVSFGQKAAHTHDLFAPIPITQTTKFKDLMASKCTVCTVAGDKSAYWFPSVFLLDDKDGSETKLEVKYTAVYYMFDTSTSTETINPIPNNLRMVVGKALAKGPEENKLFDTYIAKEAKFEAKFVAFKGSFPEKGEGISLIRLEIHTPPCMKGPDVLDSDDHISHMAYADAQSGKCPSTHPYRIPSVNIHPFFKLPKPISWTSLKDLPLRLSTTPARGNMYQWHIDVFSAWDQTTLKSLIEKCAKTSPDGCKHEFKVDNNAISQCVGKSRAANPKSAPSGKVLDATL